MINEYLRTVLETVNYHVQDIGYESLAINEELASRIVRNDSDDFTILSNYDLKFDLFELENFEENGHDILYFIKINNQVKDFYDKEILINLLIKKFEENILTYIQTEIEDSDYDAQYLVQSLHNKLTNSNFKFIIISDSMSKSLLAEEILEYTDKKFKIESLKKSILKEIKKIINSLDNFLENLLGKQNIEKKVNMLRISKIEIIYDFYTINDSNSINSINVLSRSFATPAKKIENPKMMGFVYSARLYDLFELYNSKGKKLFLKNIRLGIENLMGVDTAIMETLLTNPKEFWYLNNGVTMLVSEDTVTSNYNNYIEIIDPENEKKIGVTVINGAQTINSAAKFFIRRDFNNALKKYVEKNNKEILSEFEKKYKEREDDFERAINEAYVMLKVVEINSESKDVEKKINSITVSLNRQKPVGPVDLAYTLPVISGINMFRNEVYELRGNEKNDSMDLREFVFSIVRKGDASSINNYRYTLDILPRIMLAILDDEPGKAMSSGIKTLLQLNKAGDNFKNENLFPNSKDISLFDNDEEQFSDYNILIDKKIFEQKYKFVNFAMKLYEQIGKQQLRYEFNQKSTGTSKKKFNLYNKYLFIYIIINSLLNSNSLKKDFTNWKYTSSDVEQMLNFSNYIALIDEISGEWQLALENKGVDKIDIWQINSFKKDQYIRDVYKKVENKVRELLLTEIVGSKK